MANKWQIGTLETYVAIEKKKNSINIKKKKNLPQCLNGKEKKNTKINFYLNKHLVHLVGGWKNERGPKLILTKERKICWGVKEWEDGKLGDEG